MAAAPPARETAIARVRDAVAAATEEAANAGYVIALNIGKIVDDVVDAFALDELKLPRYYPDDELGNNAYFVGVARGIDPATGSPENLYAWWNTRLPGDRMLLDFGYAHASTDVRQRDVIASCTTNPDAVDNLCRMLMAAAAHRRANPNPPAGIVDTSDTAAPTQE